MIVVQNINEHKNYQVHKETINILEIAKKNVLKTREQWIERPFAHFVHSRIAKLEYAKRTNSLSIHCSSFWTAYYMAKNNKPFTNFESLINLQEGNSKDMGRVLHSTTVAVDTIGRVSSQMKKNF